jgi:AcrR family transcriptional regulator
MHKAAKSKKDVVSEFRHSQIVSSARAVFARKGYQATTMDEIASAAGLAKGTLYLYFKSKEEVYSAAVENDRWILQQRTLERMAATNTLLEKIAAFVMTRFEYCEERREFFKIMFMEPGVPAGPQAASVKRQDWLHEPVQQLTLAFKKASALGKIEPWPAELFAWSIADLTVSALQRRLSSVPKTTSKEDADFVIAFITAALKRRTARKPKMRKDRFYASNGRTIQR